MATKRKRLPKAKPETKVIYFWGVGFTESPPVNTVAPSIAGFPGPSQDLTCTPGTWTGSPTPTLTYQWYSSTHADGSSPTIKAGRTSVSYTVTAPDALNGLYFFCKETARNYSAVAVNSNIIGPAQPDP